jgi:hypothetical protein
VTADDLRDFDEGADADRLDLALQECAIVLRRVIGMPAIDGHLEPRVQVDPPPIIDARHGVAFAAYCAACNALSCVAFGLGVTDLDAPELMTVEQGLAAMMQGDRP